MNENERVAGLMTLSRQMMTQYHERRNLEWRIHVLLWTLLVAGAYFVGTVAINVTPLWLGAWSAVVLVFHVVWTLKMQLGQVQDQEMSAKYRKAAQTMLVDSRPELEAIIKPDHEHSPQHTMPPWLRNNLRSYWLWNVVILGTTAAMAIGLVVMAFGERAPEKQQLQDLEHQLQDLQRDERMMALELKLVRSDVEALRKISSVQPSAQPQPPAQPPGR